MDDVEQSMSYVRMLQSPLLCRAPIYVILVVEVAVQMEWIVVIGIVTAERSTKVPSIVWKLTTARRH